MRSSLLENGYIWDCQTILFIIAREFKNLTQQMINFIFVELWKKYKNDYQNLEKHLIKENYEF